MLTHIQGQTRIELKMQNAHHANTAHQTHTHAHAHTDTQTQTHRHTDTDRQRQMRQILHAKFYRKRGTDTHRDRHIQTADRQITDISQTGIR